MVLLVTRVQLGYQAQKEGTERLEKKELWGRGGNVGVRGRGGRGGSTGYQDSMEVRDCLGAWGYQEQMESKVSVLQLTKDAFTPQFLTLLPPTCSRRSWRNWTDRSKRSSRPDRPTGHRGPSRYHRRSRPHRPTGRSGAARSEG